jgi:hypothetical protein
MFGVVVEVHFIFDGSGSFAGAGGPPPVFPVKSVIVTSVTSGPVPWGIFNVVPAYE